VSKATTRTVEGPRTLPEDPKDLDEAIRPYRVLVRPVVQGLSRVSVALGAEKFDNDEIEGGVMSLSALAYQERAEVNAWWLVGMWSVSVGAPRIISAIADYEDRKAEREKVPAFLRTPEPAPQPVEKPAQPVLDLTA